MRHARGSLSGPLNNFTRDPTESAGAAIRGLLCREVGWCCFEVRLFKDGRGSRGKPSYACHAFRLSGLCRLEWGGGCVRRGLHRGDANPLGDRADPYAEGLAGSGPATSGLRRQRFF